MHKKMKEKKEKEGKETKGRKELRTGSKDRKQ